MFEGVRTDGLRKWSSRLV